MEKPNHNQSNGNCIRLNYAAIVLLGITSGAIYLFNFKIYPNINRKDYPTIYPAGAQFFSVLPMRWWATASPVLKA